MKSRYLASIEARIASSSSASERARLEARMAAFLARQGDRTAAIEICRRLREEFSANPDAIVSASLHLVDGLLDFFLDLNPSATMKFRRAYALATAASARSIQALSAAWLAHMDFSAHRFVEMGANLTRAFECAAPDDHDALNRCASVCAVALHLAGNFEAAKYWYRAARLHGVEVGDDASTSAYMHNLVAMSVMNLRQAVLGGGGAGRQEFDLLLEAESAGSYDELVGAVSLGKLLPILRANIHSLRGDSIRALDLYRDNLSAARSQGMERMAAWFMADMAKCCLSTGKREEARSLAHDAVKHLADTRNVQVDDYSAANSRLAEVFEGLGDSEAAGRFRKVAEEGWREFAERQALLLSVAGSVSSRFELMVLPRAAA